MFPMATLVAAIVVVVAVFYEARFRLPARPLGRWNTVIPALASLLVLLLSTLRASFSPGSDAELRVCGVGVLMAMISSVVMISLSRIWIAAVVVVSGCVAVIAASQRHAEGRDVA
jgi:hypothetical protein